MVREISVADPVDLWGEKAPVPGIPVDLNLIASLILAGFVLLLVGVLAHEVWMKVRRRRRRRYRGARGDGL